MKTWLLSIIGVVILVALAEMLLPSGKLKQAIRGVFGLIIMLVIIKPLPELRHSEWTFDFDLNQNLNFLEQIDARKVTAMETDGKNYLKKLGEDCTVLLSGKWTEGKYVIESVVLSVKHEPTAGNITSIAEFYHIGIEKVVIHFV